MDRRALAKPRQRRDQQALLSERRPVALGVLDQLVGFGDPDRAAASLEPVVEQDAGDLAALAGAGTVAEKPAAVEADGILGIIRCRRDESERVIDGPRAGEISAVRFAGVDDALELGVGEQAIGNEVARKMWLIGRLRRRHRGHGGGLHEPGRMGLRSGNTNRLKRVSFIKRIRDSVAFRRLPVDGLISELDAGRFDVLRSGAALRSGVREPRAQRPCRDRRGGACDRRRHGRGRSRRNVARHPVEQRGRVACRPGRSRKRRRIIGRDTIDDGQAGLGRGAVAGIDPPVDRRRKHHASAFLQADKAVAPGWIVGGEVCAGDGNQAAAVGETRQR